MVNLHNPETCPFCLGTGFLPTPRQEFEFFSWAMHISATLEKLEAKVNEMDRWVSRPLGPDPSKYEFDTKAIDELAENIQRLIKGGIEADEVLR